MKELIVLIGPNGVGKSTVAENIVRIHEKSAFVDSDWCRVINPFEITEITKRIIAENIYCLLRNYLTCEEINTVVFTYSWHGERKEIYDKVIKKLKNDNIVFNENIIILKCSIQENIRRARENRRDSVRINRGIRRTFSFYDKYNYLCIDTTEMEPVQVAEQIIEITMKGKSKDEEE